MQPYQEMHPEVPVADLATETTPALDTSGLIEEVEAAKHNIGTPVAAFNPEDPNFPKCAAHGIALVKTAWRTFEDGSATIVRDAANTLLAGLKQFTAELQQLIAHRDQQNTIAKGDLENSLKTEIRRRLDLEDGVDRPEAATAEPQPDSSPRVPYLEQRLNEAKAALDAFLIQVTGHTNGFLDLPNTTKMFVIMGVFGILYALAEIVLGTEFFRATGTRARGIATSVLVVLMIAAVTDIAAICNSIMAKWWMDRNNFRRHFPNGAFDSKGNPIHFRPLDVKVWIVGIACLVFLVVFTLQLLFFRSSLALTNQLVKGNDFAAWVLSAAIWANYLVIFNIVGDYSKALVETYSQLKAVYEAALAAFEAKRLADHQAIEAVAVSTAVEPDIDEDHDPIAELGDAPTDPIDHAIWNYRRAVVLNGKVVEDRVEQYRASAQYCLGLFEAYRTAHTTIATPGAKAAVSAILNGIDTRMGKEHKPFNRESIARQHAAAINGKVSKALVRRWENPELMALIESFNPLIPPALIETQFGDMVETLTVQLRRERAEIKQAAALEALQSPNDDFTEEEEPK